MQTEHRLYRTPARCGRCQRPVSLRISEAEHRRAAQLDPGALMSTLICNTKGCDSVVPVFARDYQRAIPRGALHLSRPAHAQGGTDAEPV